MGIEALKNGAVAAFTTVRESSDEAIRLVHDSGRRPDAEFFEKLSTLAKTVDNQLTVGNNAMIRIPGHSGIHDEVKGVKELLGKVSDAAEAGAIRTDTVDIFTNAGVHARWGAEDAVFHYTRGHIPAWGGNFGADAAATVPVTGHVPPVSSWTRQQIARGTGWG